ncbi:hypothetical protein [Allomesorhizobium camelthorni]|uniref:hypothetical protein n=1 Tax=Allomesorhizobium camelthorni TaxID=475069 RepID=UPI001FE55DDB|nr:hypothetical protein [Mesorhizobium camelthorni]
MVAFGLAEKVHHGNQAIESDLSADPSALNPSKDCHNAEAGTAGRDDMQCRVAPLSRKAARWMAKIPEILKRLSLHGIEEFVRGRVRPRGAVMFAVNGGSWRGFNRGRNGIGEFGLSAAEKRAPIPRRQLVVMEQSRSTAVERRYHASVRQKRVRQHGVAPSEFGAEMYIARFLFACGMRASKDRRGPQIDHQKGGTISDYV